MSESQSRKIAMKSAEDSAEHLALLSALALGGSAGTRFVSANETIRSINESEISEILSLANSHHVIMRTFPALHDLLAGQNNEAASCVSDALTKEKERIDRAMSFLSPICKALEEIGEVVVIKSLDHWPDLGNDLDLFIDAEGSEVVRVMQARFNAQLAERSWGDRLANKWNFIVPGLPELVEVHVARLGQTGEQVAVTRSLVDNMRIAHFGPFTAQVPAPENRIILSTLQRMYRHFYVRLCDVLDNANLIESGSVNGEVDYDALKALADPAGLWDGVATYLVIVSGYVKSYRGSELPLPALVTDAARFNSDLVHFRRKFLRIPIFPQAMRLYASEWKRLLVNGEIENTLRLSLLPGLATAAALEMKLTGSDKGIW
jgi:hypothetical protein